MYISYHKLDKLNFDICCDFLGFLSLTSSSVIPYEQYVSDTKILCAKGPEYWCSSISAAKECRATRHCIQTVWSRHTVVEDNDGICEICKEMVQEARDQLASNETQEELKEVFEGSCNLMPIKLVRLECNKVKIKYSAFYVIQC